MAPECSPHHILTVTSTNAVDDVAGAFHSSYRKGFARNEWTHAMKGPVHGMKGFAMSQCGHLCLVCS
jgi:hypothetical protein